MAGRLSEVSTWQFEALEQGADGQPECTEIWHFAADGSGWIQSGEEYVTLTWRVLTAKGADPAYALYKKGLSSNGHPDCMGQSIDPASYPRDEYGFVVDLTDTGSISICGAAEFQYGWDRTKKAPLIGGRTDCWGRITPIVQD